MEAKARLIWDFKGPTGERTAEHHLIHLGEFFARESFVCHESGSIVHSPMWHSAYVIVDLKDVQALREILKPHRGQRIAEST